MGTVENSYEGVRSYGVEFRKQEKTVCSSRRDKSNVTRGERVRGRPCQLERSGSNGFIGIAAPRTAAERKVKVTLSCLESGCKTALTVTVLRFTVRGLSQRRGWIEPVCFSFFNLSGATGVCVVTTVHSYSPRPNIPFHRRRNQPRPLPTTKSGSARHRISGRWLRGARQRMNSLPELRILNPLLELTSQPPAV